MSKPVSHILDEEIDVRLIKTQHMKQNRPTLNPEEERGDEVTHATLIM